MENSIKKYTEELIGMKNWLYLIGGSGVLGALVYAVQSVRLFLEVRKLGLSFEAGLIGLIMGLLISIIFLSMSIIVIQMVQALSYAHSEDDEVFFILTLNKVRSYFKTLGGMILVVIIFLLLPYIM